MTTENARDNAELLAEVQQLAKQLVPLKAIAAELKIDQDTIRFILQRGRWPHKPIDWSVDR